MEYYSAIKKNTFESVLMRWMKLENEASQKEKHQCCDSWGHKGSDTTEQLQFHFLLSCIGEGNGNPLQCSCLENPGDGGAWWSAVYGVKQSRTRLKRLSSSRTDDTDGCTTLGIY